MSIIAQGASTWWAAVWAYSQSDVEMLDVAQGALAWVPVPQMELDVGRSGFGITFVPSLRAVFVLGGDGGSAQTSTCLDLQAGGLSWQSGPRLPSGQARYRLRVVSTSPRESRAVIIIMIAINIPYI
jgi:hypothetical protein